jgi:hypothetical protein
MRQLSVSLAAMKLKYLRIGYYLLLVVSGVLALGVGLLMGLFQRAAPPEVPQALQATPLAVEQKPKVRQLPPPDQRLPAPVWSVPTDFSGTVEEFLSLVDKFEPDLTRGILAEALSRLNSEKITLLAKALAAWNPGDTRRPLALDAAMQHWASQEPMEVFNFGLALTNISTSKTVMAFALRRYLQSSDFTSAKRLLDQISGEELRQSTLADLSKSPFSSDPAVAIRGFVQLGGEDNLELRRSMAGLLAKDDLPSVKQWIESLPKGAERAAATHGLVKSWASQDPEAALAYAEGIAETGLRRQARMIALEALAKTKPELAATKLDMIDLWGRTDANGFQHDPFPMIQTLAEKFYERDPSAALTWASGLTDPARYRAFGQLIDTMGKSDHKAAAALAADPASGVADRYLIQETHAWANQDPKESLAFANTLSVEQRSKLWDECFGCWIEVDFAGAEAFARTPGKEWRLPQLAAELAKTDPNAALTMAAGFPSDRSAYALKSVMNQWSQQSQEAAQSHAMAETNPAQRQLLLSGVAWSKEPAEGFSWAAQLPEADRLVVAAEVGTRLNESYGSPNTRISAEAILPYVASEPDHPSLIQWSLNVSRSMMHDDPNATANWAYKLPAGAVRDAAMQQTLTLWNQQDPRSVQEWTQGVGMQWAPQPANRKN